MEWLGDGAIVVVVFGVAAAVLGLLTIMVRVRDDRGRTAGMRLQYGGMAVANLGLSLFVLSRPANVLPLPFNVAFALVFFALFARMAVAAAFLKPLQKDR